MKEISYLFSILIISKPTGELNLFTCTTKAIFAEIAKTSHFTKGTNHEDSVLPRVNSAD